MSNPPVVQVLALSEASVVVDSAYRQNADESPGNFPAKLPGSIRDAKRIHHQSLSWAQSMYGHTRENMMFRMRLVNNPPPVADPWMYCFMTPYYMFTSPDGTDETVPFATVVDGSYAADLEAALNFSMYFSGPGVMDFANPPGVVFTVRYAKSVGFLIECSGDDFEIEQSSPWLQLAHDVHGFGERTRSTGLLQYASPTAGGATDTIRSATTPNLIPSRFIGISCTEAAQRRQLSSFSNVNSQAFGSGEVNVFSTSYKANGAWETKSTPSDPTVINMNPTDGVGQLSMEMYNNLGVQVNSGNPWPLFIARFLLPVDARDLASINRPVNLQNAIVQMWSNGSVSVVAAFPLSFAPIGANVLCKSDELMHKFLMQSMG